MSTRFVRVIALVLSLACALAVSFAPMSLSYAGTSTSRFQVLHTSPDAPPVDIYTNGRRIIRDLPYSAYSRVFTVPSGSYEVEVFAAGTGPSTSQPVISGTVTLLPDSSYLLSAIGLLQNITLSVFQDPPRPERGFATIQMINLSPTIASIDLIDEAGNVLIDDVPFGLSKEVTVPTGVYELSIREHGTSNILRSYLPFTARSRAVYFIEYLDEPAAAAAESAAPRRPTFSRPR